MKLFKKIALVVILGTALVACINTQQMNEKAAQGYVQMKQQNAKTIDTGSAMAQRIHKVFNRMKPYAEQANQTGVPFKWEITVFRTNELNAWAMAGGKMGF